MIMRNKITQIIVGFLITIGSGTAVYNYTGDTLTLPDGTEMVSHDIKRSLEKYFKDRSLEVPMTIVYHHTAGSTTQSVNSISEYHVNHNRWAAIGYHIAIYQDGSIHILNDINKKTYHNSKNNTTTIGVVAVGNYENEEPSEELINSIKTVNNVLNISLNIESIKGHRDYKATLCPGNNLYLRLKNEGIIK